MMKVLVIGASGMLARPVIQELAKEGFDLRLFSRTIKDDLSGQNKEVVRGDLFHSEDLQKALVGCEAVHINLSGINEAKAVEKIIEESNKAGINLISYISGCTVAEENRWFPMIDQKFRAEQAIIYGGIPYLIFRPTWFFESLSLMVRNGKAMIIGKQPNTYRWIAADDYGKMVVNAYKKPEALNHIYYICGKDRYTMNEILSQYCNYLHPEINKVSTVPIILLKSIAKLTRKEKLKAAVDMFGYFQKVKEPEIPDMANNFLGKPEISFEQWLESRKN